MINKVDCNVSYTGNIIQYVSILFLIMDRVFYVYTSSSPISPDTHVEDFETSNIQHTDKVLPLLLGIQSFVTLLDEPLEETIEHTLAESSDGVGDLVLVTALGHELVSDLDAGLQQVLVQILAVDTQEFGDSFTFL